MGNSVRRYTAAEEWQFQGRNPPWRREFERRQAEEVRLGLDEHLPLGVFERLYFLKHLVKNKIEAVDGMMETRSRTRRELHRLFFRNFFEDRHDEFQEDVRWAVDLAFHHRDVDFSTLSCMLLAKFVLPISLAEKLLENSVYDRPGRYEDIVESMHVPPLLREPMHALWDSPDGFFLVEDIHRELLTIWDGFLDRDMQDLLKPAQVELPFIRDLLSWFRGGNPFGHVHEMRAPLRTYFQAVVPILNDIQRYQRAPAMDTTDIDALFTAMLDADSLSQNSIKNLLPIRAHHQSAWLRQFTSSAKLAALLYLGSFVTPEAFFPVPFYLQEVVTFDRLRDTRLVPADCLDELLKVALQLQESLFELLDLPVSEAELERLTALEDAPPDVDGPDGDGPDVDGPDGDDIDLGVHGPDVDDLPDVHDADADVDVDDHDHGMLKFPVYNAISITELLAPVNPGLWVS
jgi:hypothetical protein